MATPRKIAQPRSRKPRTQAAPKQHPPGLQPNSQPEAKSKDVKTSSDPRPSNSTTIDRTSRTSRNTNPDKPNHTADSRGQLGDSGGTTDAFPISAMLLNNDNNIDIDFGHDAHAHHLATLHSKRIAADPELMEMILQGYAEGNMRPRQQTSQQQQRLDTSAKEGQQK
ncbi:hypothetical protein PG984_007155 [Apiospora sp. TS-2023a]